MVFSLSPLRFLFLALLLAGSARAQAPADSSVVPAPVTPPVTDVTAPEGVTAAECSYVRCAVRVEPGFWSERLVIGESGQSMGASSRALNRVVGSDPDARVHVQAYERARFNAALAQGIGSGLLLAPLYIAADGSTRSAETATAALTAAFGVLVFSYAESQRARRELSRAVWTYNRQFAD